MSVHLRKLAPNLRGLGYTIDINEEDDGTHVAISKGEPPTAPFEAGEELFTDAQEDTDVTFAD